MAPWLNERQNTEWIPLLLSLFLGLTTIAIPLREE